MEQNQLWVSLKTLAAFIILAAILRFFSFFPSVINHDESTYILIGEGILQGKTYFVDIIDTKPIGIFLLYAGLLSLAGKSIFIMRLLMAIWIAFTAFGLYQVSWILLKDRLAARAAGISYILLTSIFTYYGVNPNTELYFNLFTILAIWCVLSGQQWWRFLLVGGLLGLGFMIKYVVLFDALAIGLFLLWRLYASQEMQKLPDLVGKLALMVLAFSTPFLLTYFYYDSIGQRDTFLYYTFEVTSKYPVDTPWWKSVVFVAEFLLRFFPLTIMAIYAWRKTEAHPDKHWKTLVLLWVVLDLFIILWPGKLFGHYFIQLMLPFCLLGGFFFSKDCPKPAFWLKIPSKWGYGLLGLLGLIIVFFQKMDYYDKPDFPREIAAYLQPLLKQEDQIYTGNYHHILYFLVGKASPTAYVHRSLLWHENNVRALGVDLEKETEIILEQNPRYIFLNGEVPDNVLSQKIYENYQLQRKFGDEIRLYERKQDEK
ncbi:MAG: hypothetical protein DHS20C18_46260 [Saprospiraceae bacterium]|nr:MAG: hypothetical protein DHS20C18_46260 [Saprospiraceae bacterium]